MMFCFIILKKTLQDGRRGTADKLSVKPIDDAKHKQCYDTPPQCKSLFSYTLCKIFLLRIKLLCKFIKFSRNFYPLYKNTQTHERYSHDTPRTNTRTIPTAIHWFSTFPLKPPQIWLKFPLKFRSSLIQVFSSLIKMSSVMYETQIKFNQKLNQVQSKRRKSQRNS
jgi:hypothetical protein